VSFGMKTDSNSAIKPQITYSQRSIFCVDRTSLIKNETTANSLLVL
jgi:hypothetical protein